MKFLGLIPARYASTRFPGKPLVMLGGKPIIQRVYEQVKGMVDELFVATDDERIAEAVKGFGGEVVMTGSHHQSGTDRCYEAYANLGREFDVVVNIQGDEPFIQPSQIELLKAQFASGAEIATLVKPFESTTQWSVLSNPNTPKVVFNDRMQALLFSRSVIPYLRGAEPCEWASLQTYYKHIGLYAYRSDVLPQITALSPSRLEKIESLEQLRWLENGFDIRVAITQEETIGIDTPEDLLRAEKWLIDNFVEKPVQVIV